MAKQQARVWTEEQARRALDQLALFGIELHQYQAALAQLEAGDPAFIESLYFYLYEFPAHTMRRPESDWEWAFERALAERRIREEGLLFVESRGSAPGGPWTALTVSDASGNWLAETYDRPATFSDPIQLRGIRADLAVEALDTPLLYPWTR